LALGVEEPTAARRQRQETNQRQKDTACISKIFRHGGPSEPRLPVFPNGIRHTYPRSDGQGTSFTINLQLYEQTAGRKGQLDASTESVDHVL
jgi:hypothetical protein